MAVDAAATTPEEFYLAYVSRWRTADRPTHQSAEGRPAMCDAWPPLADPMARMMYVDAVSYLPDDLLVKIDRATMAVGLEGRAPMLDHEIVAFAWRLPTSLKIRDGQTKWPLRQVLYRYVPREIVERPKQGFEPPIGGWLRGPLRDWAESLLRPDRLVEGGLLSPTPVRRIWEEHLKGLRDWRFELWNVLMFQAWRAHWGV
jgi:asparagine synthase (glutamine-hydrolysing)